ncbi:polysaccharide deacetylase family protein [Bacteroides stercorirosoris]|uniref:polysaccharide deacetylase family protein n=1 Tax=Bacteroides stercorirosoris TaxID=871324 RepID=UPI00046E6CA8|nr:polysaccharide deacetylase family protein [Bacteroides stercorirosoris]
MNGHFLISLDFELVWGLAGWDLSQIEHYKQNLFSAKDALYKIVCLLEKYNMKCTVGYVGAMNHVSQQELYNTNNILIPAYSNHLYASFGSLLPYMNRELDERLFLAHQEIEMLQKKANVEVASHTYSHYYCLEEGQTIDDFENDVRMAITNAKNKVLILFLLFFLVIK